MPPRFGSRLAVAPHRRPASGRRPWPARTGPRVRNGPLVVDQVQPLGVDLERASSVSVTVKSLGANARLTHVCDARSSNVARLAVLEPHQAGVEHGDPVVLALHDVRRVGDRVGVEPEVLLHGAPRRSGRHGRAHSCEARVGRQARDTLRTAVIRDGERSDGTRVGGQGSTADEVGDQADDPHAHQHGDPPTPAGQQDRVDVQPPTREVVLRLHGAGDGHVRALCAAAGPG